MNAFDGNDEPLPVMIFDEVTQETLHYLLMPAVNLTIRFLAFDNYDRQIHCDVKLVITGQLLRHFSTLCRRNRLFLVAAKLHGLRLFRSR